MGESYSSFVSVLLFVFFDISVDRLLRSSCSDIRERKSGEREEEEGGGGVSEEEGKRRKKGAREKGETLKE